MPKCERCGAELTKADFTPCRDDAECPLLKQFDDALRRSLAKVEGRSEHDTINKLPPGNAHHFRQE